MEEKKEKKKRKRSKTITIDNETGIISGQYKLRQIGDTYYICVPKEFVEQHNLKKGDPLPFAGNHILKYIPIKET